MDKFEELRKFKELLDDGIITQVEFQKKKEQLLEISSSKALEATNSVTISTPDTSEVSEENSINEQTDILKDIESGPNEVKEGFTSEEYSMSENESQQVEEVENSLIEKNEKDENRKKPEEPNKAKEEERQVDKEKNNKRRNDLVTKKTTKPLIAAACILIVLLIAYFAYVQPKVIKPMQEYNRAIGYLAEGNFRVAKDIFTNLGDYKDAHLQVENCEIAYADDLVSDGKYEHALEIYNSYKDNPNVSDYKLEKCKDGIYQEGIALYEEKSYESAKEKFKKITDYSDSSVYIEKCDSGIQKVREGKAKAAKEAAEKEAAEEKEKMQKLVGTWYAKKVVNYRDEDMTSEMDDLSTCYFTFKDDGTGICHLGEYLSLGGGTKEFTWKIQEIEGYGDDAVGMWTLNGDSDIIWYYGDHILIYTDKMDSIFYDMRFFCYK